MTAFFMAGAATKVKTFRPEMTISSPVWVAPSAPLGTDSKIPEVFNFDFFASFQRGFDNFECGLYNIKSLRIGNPVFPADTTDNLSLRQRHVSPFLKNAGALSI